MKQDIKWHETCKCKYRLDASDASVIVNNVGMMINVDANVRNRLIKVHAIKDMFGIPVVVSVGVINCVLLVSI